MFLRRILLLFLSRIFFFLLQWHPILLKLSSFTEILNIYMQEPSRVTEIQIISPGNSYSQKQNAFWKWHLKLNEKITNHPFHNLLVAMPTSSTRSLRNFHGTTIIANSSCTCRTTLYILPYLLLILPTKQVYPFNIISTGIIFRCQGQFSGKKYQ